VIGSTGIVFSEAVEAERRLNHAVLVRRGAVNHPATDQQRESGRLFHPMARMASICAANVLFLYHRPTNWLEPPATPLQATGFFILHMLTVAS